MHHLRRRQVLRRAALATGTAGALGASATAGCASPVPGGPPGDLPAPFTRLAHAGSYDPDGTWPMAGHDAARSGRADTPVPTGDVDVAWLRWAKTGSVRAHSPVVGPRWVYFGYAWEPPDRDERRVHLAAFDARTGERRLDRRVGTGDIVGLALAGDTPLVLTGDPAANGGPTMTAVDTDRNALSRVDLPPITGPPAVRDGVCYLASRDEDNPGTLADSAVYAVEPDGNQLWRAPLLGPAVTAPCTDGETVYVGLQGGVAAVDLAAGEERWVRWLDVLLDGEAGEFVGGTPTVVDGRLYVPGSGRVTALDAADGTLDWTSTVGEYGELSVAVADGVVYAGHFVALDAASGDERWRADDLRLEGLPAAGADGTAVVGTRGAVTAVDGPASRPWTVEYEVPETDSFPLTPMYPSVALAHGMCYLGLADGRLYAIGATG
ncbi:MAG: PQQ-binding-like beta-propeller repeat protein [Halobacteriaceae archaeon]